MSSDNVALITSMSVPSAVKFNAKNEFQTHTQQQELDRAFLGCGRRPWIQEKMKRDSRRERQMLTALLSTSNQNDSIDCVEKLVAEDISFRDLASLTEADLEIFGFKHHKQRQDLITKFNKMPNQDPSYEYICKLPDAATYNNEIIRKAANHLMSMRSSLAATNYKLEVMPPEDVLVGDKRYASRFALEAINSVQLITDELSKDLRKLEDITASGASEKKKNSLIWTVFYCTAIVIGTVAWLLYSKPRTGIRRISLTT
ncbi:uncharacterized protein LOC115631579 [Scaptodrosophila lebanonensis]|uniref:Uncharacterized protein LOC115631579 n=1 Tax=Drosophila lebanonensis TaxID=7225 RepID=A0A6J2U8C2_DROLE|nr:uncharacterized protein LOC115631579 [Scaptodrosophila lebanonensis]